MITLESLGRQSSIIRSIGWKRGDLYVEFFTTGWHKYIDVPKTVYLEVMAADSIGSAFHKLIRNSYTVERVDNPGGNPL